MLDIRSFCLKWTNIMSNRRFLNVRWTITSACDPDQLSSFEFFASLRTQVIIKWGASEKFCQKENLDRGEKALEEQMMQARKTWKLSRLASLTMYTQRCFFIKCSHESNQSQRVFLVVSPSARIDCQRDDLWAHRKLSSPPVLCHSALLPCTALPCVNKEPDKSLLCPWYDLICGSQLALIVDLSSWKALFWLVTQHFITSLDRPDFGEMTQKRTNDWFNMVKDVSVQGPYFGLIVTNLLVSV